jgi:predicted Zn-dependent protease
MEKDRAREICERALSFASADEAEVLLQGGASALTRFANNSIEQNVNETGHSVSVRAVIGKKVGRASTNSLDDASLKKAVESAELVARYQKDDEELLPLPEPQEYQEVPNFVEATASFSPTDRAEAISNLVNRCRSETGLTTAGIFSNESQHLALANSKGVFAYDRMTSAVFSATVMTDDSAGWAEDSNKDVTKIDLKGVADTAVEKALTSRKPVAVEPGEYTVVLEPAAAANLLIFLGWLSFGALSYQEGRSFLSGKLGQKVFGDNITIEDNVYDELSSGLPFDFEGVPRRKVTLVENGVAKALVHDRKTAKKAGEETTGHGLPVPNTSGPIPLNMVMKTGDASVEDMIASTKKGILVTQFHYTNTVNPMKLMVTGMTRNGTFLIEDGKVTKAVKNMRMTESLEKVLNNVEMIGKDAIKRRGFFGGGLVVPALKVKNFTFSSGTDF